MNSLTRPTALILNFTGNVYHWGCYGTSAEIYQSLLELGCQVNWLDVRTMHALTPHPRNWEELQSPAFITGFIQRQPAILHALSDADVIVVNGEGTLHRTHRAPMNLLFLMHLARAVLGKPVHLINHSLFPGGDESPAAEADELYRRVVLPLASVVPRETTSQAVLRRLGRETPLGFDCLPRFIARHQVRPATSRRGPIVVSGGVNLPPGAVAGIMAGLAPHATADRRIVFLTGAKSEPAAEDATIYDWMAMHLPSLELVSATSMAEWLESIASASCLVSGRFHHTIAAATLGTPALVFPSNTPKVPAMCAMFGLPAPIPYDDPQLTEKVESGVADALRGTAPVASLDHLKAILEAGARNFAGL